MRKLLFALVIAAPALAANDAKNPIWWEKYQYILNNGATDLRTSSATASFGSNVDVSNECGPQSETFIAINPSSPKVLAAGSNEIYRLPMRGYFSTDNGATWGGVDLPLPGDSTGRTCSGSIGTNGTCFGSDPSLAFDSSGHLYYSYIVVFFSAGAGNGTINGTEMAVARSDDGGKTYPNVTYFEFSGGANHFNDKPMITTDTNAASSFRGSVYVAWDAASGGSAGGGVRVARSRDGGKTFTTTRVDDPNGPGRSIGATVTTGPQGQVYVAWNDYAQNKIVFNSSVDGGVTWGTPTTIANKQAQFDVAVPAEFNRAALVYPACDADRSKGAHRGRITCSWMDKGTLNTDILASFSDDEGKTWNAPGSVADRLANVDRFNHWLATDPVTGTVNVSFYDTRNDTTGSRFQTDVYLSQGDGEHFGANVRVSNGTSNEHDCNGEFPCTSINYGNQQGDYEGIAAYGGVVHPIWTDSRRNTEQMVPACGRGHGLMEEVFTATIK
jgi:hypothetical protein